jgi:hypothetical protein
VHVRLGAVMEPPPCVFWAAAVSVGDQMRFDAPDNGIDTATPMDLNNLSQERGVGILVEHGWLVP